MASPGRLAGALLAALAYYLLGLSPLQDSLAEPGGPAELARLQGEVEQLRATGAQARTRLEQLESKLRGSLGTRRSPLG